MTSRLRLCWLGLVGLFVAMGCAAPVAPVPSPGPERAHYRSYASAAALAAALRVEATDLPRFSAHRGGHGPEYPENALATFAHTLRYAPALLETDVRLTRDSVLVLLHDETLDRTTTGTGRLDAHTLADLRPLLLLDDLGRVTLSRLPTLAEALAWSEGRAVFTLDVKRDVPPRVLVAAIRRARAENRVVVITYSADDLAAYLALAPDLVYSIPATSVDELAEVEALPAFDASRAIGFVGVSQVPQGVVTRLHALGIPVLVGVFGEDEAALRRGDARVLARYRALGADIVATGAVAEAAALD